MTVPALVVTPRFCKSVTLLGQHRHMSVLNFPWRRGSRPLEQGPPTSQPSENLELFAAVVEALPDAVLVVRREGTTPPKILTSNTAAREMLRIGLNNEQLVSVLRHPDVLSAVDGALQGREEHTLSYDTAGPRSKALRAWVRPLSAAGTALIVLRDETEARRLERMRVDFLANASHELRTPLASLAGFIETLQCHAKEDAEARDRFLTIMSAQAKRMSRLIDDLLSLSRIELNEHVPPSGTCDLSLVAREAIDGLLPVISTKEMRLEMEAPPSDEALATGERDQIAQVVQNLIDNAVKYSPEGAAVSIAIAGGVAFEPELTVTDLAELRDAGGGRLTLLSPERGHQNQYVRVRVTDRGGGIAREHLPRLTERFYRVPGQKSGEIVGTGLGLAIVKHIVNRHRGALLVESAPGLGTTFTVYLPAVQRDESRRNCALPG